MLWLRECMDSVDANLPKDAQHVVVQCSRPEDLAWMRWDCLKLAEFVAFIDDDDLILNDGLNKCLSALRQAGPDCGIAFTDEQTMHHYGDHKVTVPHKRCMAYRDFTTLPAYGAHHLTMYRTSKVPSILGNYLELTGASDWVCSSGTAVMTSAIHVPEICYQWRVHAGGIHRSKEDRKLFKGLAPRAREFLKSVQSHDPTERVPTYTTRSHHHEVDSVNPPRPVSVYIG